MSVTAPIGRGFYKLIAQESTAIRLGSETIVPMDRSRAMLRTMSRAIDTMAGQWLRPVVHVAGV